MPSFLVETYLARGRASERPVREGRARAAAAELSNVSFRRSIHIPEDEICFFVFDAPTGGAVALAAERAGLEALRVVEAISSGKEEQ